MVYNRTSFPKFQNTPDMYFFEILESFIIRFSESEFSQDCSILIGH